jgi:hypothetical protein
MEKIAKARTGSLLIPIIIEPKNSIKKLDNLINIAELVTIDTAFRSQSEIDGMWSEIDELDTESNNLIINSNLNNYLLTINPLKKQIINFN